MTPDEINRTLLEFEGYEPCQPYVEINDSRVRWFKGGCYYDTEELPNYLCPTTGLSHCRRVQLLLTDEQHQEFRNKLKTIVGRDGNAAFHCDKARRLYISASASQVAQALYAVLKEGR